MERKKEISAAIIYIVLLPLSAIGILSAAMATGSPGQSYYLGIAMLLLWASGPIYLAVYSTLCFLGFFSKSQKVRKGFNIMNPYFPVHYLLFSVVCSAALSALQTLVDNF